MFLCHLAKPVRVHAVAAVSATGLHVEAVKLRADLSGRTGTKRLRYDVYMMMIQDGKLVTFT